MLKIAEVLAVRKMVKLPHEIPLFLAKVMMPPFPGAASGGQDPHARHPQSPGARSDLQRC